MRQHGLFQRQHLVHHRLQLSATRRRELGSTSLGLGKPRPDLFRRVLGGQGGEEADLDPAAAHDGGAVLGHGHRGLKVVRGDDRVAAVLGRRPGLTEHRGALEDRPAGVHDIRCDDVVDERTPRRQAVGVSGGVARATGVLVFTLSGRRVSAITRFDDTVLARFGVPATLPG